MTAVMDQILDVVAAGQRPLQKRFALERLAKVQIELLDAIDGGDECRGRDTWISGLLRDLDYVESQIRSIR